MNSFTAAAARDIGERSSQSGEAARGMHEVEGGARLQRPENRPSIARDDRASALAAGPRRTFRRPQKAAGTNRRARLQRGITHEWFVESREWPRTLRDR